jgi:putative membrane protein insertion efficiency factor
MYRVLSIERTRREPSGPYGTYGGRQLRAAQPREAPGPGSIPSESGCDSGRLGHRSESAQGCVPGAVSDPGAGVDAAVSCRPSECDAKRAGGSPSLVKTFALALIAFYRAAISPAIPSSCRFYPTCSAYAHEAVSEWGLRRGLGLTLKRLGRCRPFGPYGFDPVPERPDRASSQGVEISGSRLCS